MYQRDYRDVAAGALLMLIGAGVAYYSATGLALGSIQRMGPGLFPAALGVILAGFGLLLAIPALFRAGTRIEEIEWRSVIGVLGSVAAFAATVRLLGIVPATVLLVLIAHFAEERFRPVALLSMMVVLPASAYAIFILGLGLPLAMFRWPF